MIVSGANVVDGRVWCHFGDLSVEGQVLSASKVECVTPEGKEGEVKTYLSRMEAGDGARGGVSFEYVEPAIVSGLMPSMGSVGSRSMYIASPDSVR